MQRGVIICLKKSGEYGAKYPISEGEVCKFGPGFDCHLRFMIKQGKGVFCALSADEEGLVQLKKLSSCPVSVNDVEIDSTTELTSGDLIEIQGRKFVWESITDTDCALDCQEKTSSTNRISSTTQIHGRKSLNEFRANNKLSKSTERLRFWTESDENMATSSYEPDIAGFSVSTSPIRLSYGQTTPGTKTKNCSFKIKLKSPKTSPKKTMTPKGARVKNTLSKSAIKAPKTPVLTTRADNIPLKAITKSETKKYFESNNSTGKFSKIPRKYFFTPVKVSPKVTTSRTPRSNVKNLEIVDATGKNVIKQRTPAQKVKTPNVTRKPYPVQITKKTPKSTKVALKENVRTPRSLKTEISNHTKHVDKMLRGSKTPSRIVKAVNMKTPKSAVKRTLESAQTPKSKAKESKSAENVKIASLKSSSLSISSPNLSLIAVSPLSNNTPKKFPRISIHSRKSSIKKFTGKKRKFSGGNNSFERSPKRRNIGFDSSIDSEKENYVSNSSIIRSPSLKSEEIESNTCKEAGKLFNSFVYLEKNDFVKQLQTYSRQKALTQPKVTTRNLRRTSAPGRYARLLKLNNSKTSTPKKLQTETSLLQNVFAGNSDGNITPIVSINVNYNTNITYTGNFESNPYGPSTSNKYHCNLSGINQLSNNTDLISLESPERPVTKSTSLRKSRSSQKRISILNNSNLASSVIGLNSNEEMLSSKLDNSNISPRKSLKSNVNSSNSFVNIELNESRDKTIVTENKSKKKSPKNNSTNRSRIKHLINRANSPKNDLSNVKGIKKLFATPKLRSSPRNDLRDVKGVKKLMQTPGRKQNSPKNDLTDIRGVKTLMRTPKSPKNDLRNVEGVKQVMTSKSPYNDITDVTGVRNLFRTIKLKRWPRNSLTNVADVKTPSRKQKSPKNDLSDVKGVRALMKTRKCPKDDLRNVDGVKRLMNFKPPVNDLRDDRGVKKIMKTPKANRSPRNELTDLRGIRKLMMTPKLEIEPMNDLTDVKGIKRLFTAKMPEDNLSDVAGVKEIFETPKLRGTPRNDVSNLRNVSILLKTPLRKSKSPTNVTAVKKLMIAKSPKNDLTNVVGIKRLMTSKSPKNDLSDIEGVNLLFSTARRSYQDPQDSKQTKKSTPKMLKSDNDSDSPSVNRVSSKIVEKNEKSKSENKSVEIKQTPTFNTNNTDDLFDQLKGNEDSSLNEAIQKLMNSSPKRTYERRTKSLSPDKQINRTKNRNSLRVVPRKSSDVRKWVEAQKMYLLDKPSTSNEKEQIIRNSSPRVVLETTDEITNLMQEYSANKISKEENGNSRATKKRKIITENRRISSYRTRSRRAKENNAKEDNSSEKAATPKKRSKSQLNIEVDVITTNRTRKGKQKEGEPKETQHLDSTPVTNETRTKKARGRAKKVETQALNEVPEIVSEEQSNEKHKKRKGKKVVFLETEQEQEKTIKTRHKRKAESKVSANDVKNIDEQLEPANKKRKTKNLKLDKEQNENVEKEIFIMKTRRQAKETDKQDAENEKPTKKKIRGKSKTEIEAQINEIEESEPVIMTSRRQAKKSNPEIEGETVKANSGRVTRKKGVTIEEENTDHPALEKPIRNKKANSTTKNQLETDVDETKNEKKPSTRRNKAIAEEAKEQVRRSARTRNRNK